MIVGRPGVLLVALASLATLGAAPVATNYRIDEPMARPADARLAWSDEFDGTRLDPRKWRYDISRNKLGWYNGELQYYADGRPENVRVENGRLIIEARREDLDPKKYPDWGGQHYTSAKIATQGKAAWTYGFFEVRAKLPCARGTWPAIWMLPETGGWPDGGEIDIMEQVGSQPEVVHATLHTALFVHSRGTQRGAELNLPGSCSDFHLYQLDWRATSITIGVDGHAYMRVRNDQPGGRGAWPFDAPFHMILNLAMGGGWAAARGMDDAALPQRMEVDYVRVWQRR
jgi:beta-glucanase (GH16 family)